MEEPCRSDEKGETEKGLFVGDNRLQTNEASGSSDALIGKEDTTPSSERRNIYGNDPGETEQRGNRSRNNNNDGTRPADAAFPEGEEDGMLEGELIVQYSMDSDIGGLVAAPSLQNYHNKDSSTGSRTMTEGAPKVHHDLRYDDMDDAAAGVGEFRQKSHPATSDQQHEMEGGNSVIGSQRRQVAAPMQEETPVNEGKVHPGTEESTGTPTAAPSSLRPEVLQQRSTSEETAASPRPQPQQQHGVQTKGRFQFQPQSHAPDVVDEIKGVPGSSSSSTRSTTSSQHHSFLSIDSNHEQQQHQHTTPPLHHHSKRSQQQHQVNNTTLKGQPPIVSRHYSLPLTTGNSGTDETIPPAETIPALGTAPPIAGTATSSQPDSASNGQVVTKKKGRFNFLEVTPATSSTTTSRSASPGRTVEPPPETSEYQQRHERSFSASSAPTGSLTPPNLAGKAFDGSGSLVVRKKGRFVVTSVPVSSSTQQQQQIGASTTESQMSAPPNRPRESTADTQQSHYAQTTVQSAPIMNSGQLQIQASNSWNDGIATPILLDHSMSQSSTNNGVGGNGTSLSVLYINNLQSPGSMIDLNSAETHAAATQQHFTCAADDGSAVPISTANTTTTLQPRATATPRPVPVTSRSSTTSGLAAQHQGFGKMLYFLDQMKVEVSDADKSIKSLQTDTKFLVRCSQVVVYTRLSVQHF